MVAALEGPENSEDEKEAEGIENRFINQIVGSFMPVRDPDDASVCGEGEKSRGDEKAEKAIKNEEVEGCAFLGPAAHDFALGEDISEDSRNVIGSPSDFFAFHPVA